VAISVPSVVKKWSVGEAYSILEKIDKGEDTVGSLIYLIFLVEQRLLNWLPNFAMV